ncbi:hypothetical protein Tco_0866567 [Tanacetum coccineum]
MACRCARDASSMARLATSSKMARRTLRQVHLVTLTRKPDTSSRVFAITQNQTTNISEELPGISSNPRRRYEHVGVWEGEDEWEVRLLGRGDKSRSAGEGIVFRGGRGGFIGRARRCISAIGIAEVPVVAVLYGFDKSYFHKFLDKFVIVLIDDILIFSKSNKEHEDQLCTVIHILRQEKLYAKFSKCKFWLSKVVLLGHVVPAEGIAMDPAKVEAVTKWPRPTSETEAHSFLKLAGHYHKVVEVFSLLALPLTKLTRKDEKLYGPKSERRSLKNVNEGDVVFEMASILFHFLQIVKIILIIKLQEYIQPGDRGDNNGTSRQRLYPIRIHVSRFVSGNSYSSGRLYQQA